MVEMTNIEQKKAEIRRRIKLRKYPRRIDAHFTDENNHNPLLLADCSRCLGRGKVCREVWEGNAHSISQEVCAICSGTGITEEIVRYFENDEPVIDVEANEEGWVKCPCCGWTFAIKDANVWTGRRHKRCGQKLNLV